MFGQFELDANGYKLRREGGEVPLQAKVFDAIRYTGRALHDRVVRKEELLEALWPGEHVNGRRTLDDQSRSQGLGQGPEAKDPIETVRGRGYRFTAEVTQVQPTTARAPPRRRS